MADSSDDKLERIVQARLKLRERFQRDMAATASLADPAPLGSGPPNRHGMPRLPPDQYETKKWPVLDLGILPSVTQANFSLRIDGAVTQPLQLDWAALHAFEQVSDVSDFHCVTKWSRMDIPWAGVRAADVIAAAQPTAAARFVMCYASDGYMTNLPLAEVIKSDVLLAHTADGAPLAPEHGGPLRMVTPQLYAWKGAKWLCRLELLAEDRLGFWEARGYSNTAYPWRNDRYS